MFFNFLLHVLKISPLCFSKNIPEQQRKACFTPGMLIITNKNRLKCVNSFEYAFLFLPFFENKEMKYAKILSFCIFACCK